MQKQDETASKRIPVTPTAWEAIKDFCSGMGVNYSEGLMFLLEQVTEPGEDAMLAGRRLRIKLNNAKNQEE